MLAARGAYLLHGGTPEGWGQMRADDVQLIFIMHNAELMRLSNIFGTTKD